MAEIERVTITVPQEMAAMVRAAVASGEYASSSEVMREALRDWRIKRATQVEQLEALRRDIAKGMADVEAGRVQAFDLDTIIARGRELLAKRTPSA